MGVRARVIVGFSALVAAATLGAGLGPASAAEQQTDLVTDVASTATPRVIGGQCYGSVGAPAECRKISTLIKIGSWIYAGGIIDKVGRNNGSNVINGFSNLMRFNAVTKALDPDFRPQLFTTAGRVDDSEVTGLAASADGNTIYAAGKFKTVKSSPSDVAVPRKGIAAFDAATGAVGTAFNANVCVGGGLCTVSDVKLVGPALWIGGDFNHVGGVARTALASVDPATGALTAAVQLPVSGQAVSTSATKVTKIRLNPGSSRAILLGNFTKIAAQTREEVAVVNVNPGSGAAAGLNAWNAPTHLHAAVTSCKRTKVWPRDAEWSPTGSFFVIVGTGGGGGHPYPAPCDALTRWENNDNPNSTPTGYNHTEIDTILSVCNVGTWSYVGGHFKSLNQEVRHGNTVVKPPPGQVNATHYGLGVIDTTPTSMLAVPNWNNTDQTGRGEGWGAALCVPGSAASGGGVYMGGDSVGVNGNPQVQRLAYFAAAH